MPDPIYTAEALSTGGGRDGRIRTTDGALDSVFSAPRELGGAGNGLNPELLFAAGYAGCFHSAVLGAARFLKTDVTGSSVGARVSLTPSDDGGVDLSVHLEVVLPRLSEELAAQIVEVAHQGCPYSKATRGNISVTIDVTDD